MRPLSVFVLVNLLAIVLSTTSASALQVDPSCDIVGTEGNDVLVGTDADEKICGLGGDDVIRGGRGNDTILGGPGSDRLIGGAGRDILKGGHGDDQLFGQTGRDRLVGNQGSDLLDGGGGRNRLVGGAGDDICRDRSTRSKKRGCEREGEPKDFNSAKAQWNSSGVNEFVYSVSESPFCEDGFACPAVLSAFGVVNVRNGSATSNAQRLEARNAESLFAAAQTALRSGGKVRYHVELGLPIHIGSTPTGQITIEEVEIRDDIRARALEAQAKWAAEDIDDYEYSFRTICFCVGFGDIRVIVRNGEVSAVLPGDSAEPPQIPSARTIDGHFGELFDLLDGHHISVTGQFDEVLGFPMSYGHDTSRLIADEEMATQIFNFHAGGENGALRILSIAGIEVDETLAPQLQSLVDAAAADGFTLSGGGYRDPAGQIALRRANCGTSDYAIFELPASQCSPPTARPGQSLHEQGLAVDFTIDGRLITSRAEPAFLWLEANAEDYGFFNHPAETWHWSINGN